jgi:hypothetical protein
LRYRPNTDATDGRFCPPARLKNVEAAAEFGV